MRDRLRQWQHRGLGDLGSIFCDRREAQNGRILVNAYEVAKTNSFYLANRDFANANVQHTRDVIAGLTEAARWAEAHRDAVRLRSPR